MYLLVTAGAGLINLKFIVFTDPSGCIRAGGLVGGEWGVGEERLDVVSN